MKLRTMWARAAAATCLATVIMTPQAATAATSGCSATAHCYSNLWAHGTTYYGMYGTWNRAYMSAGGATTTNRRFINSEMWLAQSNTNTTPWAEIGMKRGFFVGDGSVGYMVFGEWINGTNRGFHNFGGISANGTVTDEFQISRGSSTNVWKLYWNGTPWATGNTGFWASTRQQMGGEVATAYGDADQFHMYGKGITSSGTRVNFATDEPLHENNTADLSGSRPADSTWYWSVK